MKIRKFLCQDLKFEQTFLFGTDVKGIGSDESFASSNGLLLLPARVIEERGEKRGNNACEESGNGQLGQLALRLINFVLTASTPVDCLGLFFRRCSLY